MGKNIESATKRQSGPTSDALRNVLIDADPDTPLEVIGRRARKALEDD